MDFLKKRKISGGFRPSRSRSDGTRRKRPLKEFGLFLADILYNAVVIIVLVILIRTFLISPFRVIGSSMADTLLNNEFILIDKLSYRLGLPQRGDPIVFLPPITNKYPHKFEEVIITEDTGSGVLDINLLRTDKQVFYCQNPWVKSMWFCQDKVTENDLVYYRPIRDAEGDMDISWQQAYRKQVTDEEIKQGQLTIQGSPNQSYLVRIYNSTGPEYFVKRIIGIPGDTIRIENGRVYLKAVESDSKAEEANDFTELDEVYLNEENKLNTYFKQTSGLNEFVVPEGRYFVLGDNRNHSNDSRHWFSPINEDFTPYVDYKDISGRVMIVLWPPNDMHLIPSGVLH